VRHDLTLTERRKLHQRDEPAARAHVLRESIRQDEGEVRAGQSIEDFAAQFHAGFVAIAFIHFCFP